MESALPGNYQTVKPYLFAVAYRMTGSAADAEDLVQDAWLRFLDAGAPAVDSLRAYLTTIVSRLALDHLKSARVQREQYVGEWLPEPVLTSELMLGPAESAEQREEVSIAFLTLLERLTPEQRVVYVLREGFGYSHDEIAATIGKSAAASRQIFHRAQDRIDKGGPHQPATIAEHQQVLDQFAQAFSSGNAELIAQLLSDDTVWMGDGGGKRLSTMRPIVGADRVYRGLAGALPIWIEQMRHPLTIANINGTPALLMWNDEGIETVLAITVRNGKVWRLQALRNPDKLRHLEESLARATAV